MGVDRNELENAVKDLAKRASNVYAAAAEDAKAMSESKDVPGAVTTLEKEAKDTGAKVGKILNAMGALLAKPASGPK